MKYKIDIVGTSLEVFLTKKLTFADQPVFRVLLEEMNNSNATQWTINLTNLDFIDSSGLGLLIRFKKEAEDKGVDLLLHVYENDYVRKVLELACFSELIEYE